MSENLKTAARMRPGRRSVYSEYAELSESIREGIRAAAAWLPPIQRPDGSFLYTYNPVADRYDQHRYNEVRHAGVTYALFQACALIDDGQVRSTAHRAAEYIVGSSITVPSGGAAYVYQGNCKLGALALAIVALLEGKRVLETTEWDETIAAFSGFLLDLELPDEPGRFHQSYDIASHQQLLTPASNYYPGEALLALVRLHRAFPEGPWLAAAQRAAHYLIHIKDGDQIAAHAVPREDHWLAMALSELYRWDPNPDYVTIALLQAARFMENQHGEDAPEPWMIGGAKRMASPSAVSTATQIEALVAIWELARVLGDSEWIERISTSVVRSIRFLLRMQYTTENTAAFSQPQRAIGAWSQVATRHYIRIDFVQHGLSALIGALRQLEEDTSDSGPAIRIADARFVGPHNRWTTKPVIRATLHGNSAFREKEQELIEAGQRITQLAISLQRSAGDEAELADAWPGSTPGDIEIVFECRYAEPGLEALNLAAKQVTDALPASPAPDPELWRSVAAVHPALRGRTDMRAVLSAAVQRDIPVRSIDHDRSLIQLGTGAYSRRFWKLSTSSTSLHGAWIAKDKHLTSELLRSAGYPAPRSIVVTTPDAAVEAAGQLGYPVVLKPNRGNQGREVFVGIEGESALRALIATAYGGRLTGDWLIEEFVPGREHRVLVLGGTVAAVNLRQPPVVIGDGESSVAQLISRLNADPARSFRKGFALKPVVPGPQHVETIRRQGLTLDSVPESGREVVLNSVSNVSAGGSAIDVTDLVHPDNARVAAMAAQAVGLDFAGLDLVVPDISTSIWETGGAIIEVNSNPGVIDHVFPGAGTPRDIGASIVDRLFPPGQRVRAPVVAVMASAHSEAICRQVAQTATERGVTVGLATATGIVIDGAVHRRANGSDHAGARVLMNNPLVELAVVEIDPEQILENSLGFDACDVAIIESLSGLMRPDGRPIETVLLDALAADGLAVLDEAHSAGLAEQTDRTVMLVDMETGLAPGGPIDQVLRCCMGG